MPMKKLTPLIFTITLCFIIGCALANETGRCREIVKEVMTCWVNGDAKGAQRYLRWEPESAGRQSLKKLKRFVITDAKAADQEVTVNVDVTHAGGITGEYPSNYIFRLRRFEDGWKIVGLVHGGGL